MTHDMTRGAARIDPADLPELETVVGLAGAMRHAEVGGLACTETGVLLAVMSFSASAQ